MGHLLRFMGHLGPSYGRNPLYGRISHFYRTLPASLWATFYTLWDTYAPLMGANPLYGRLAAFYGTLSANLLNLIGHSSSLSRVAISAFITSTKNTHRWESNSLQPMGVFLFYLRRFLLSICNFRSCITEFICPPTNRMIPEM